MPTESLNQLSTNKSRTCDIYCPRMDSYEIGTLYRNSSDPKRQSASPGDYLHNKNKSTGSCSQEQHSHHRILTTSSVSEYSATTTDHSPRMGSALTHTPRDQVDQTRMWTEGQDDGPTRSKRDVCGVRFVWPSVWVRRDSQPRHGLLLLYVQDAPPVRRPS